MHRPLFKHGLESHSLVSVEVASHTRTRAPTDMRACAHACPRTRARTHTHTCKYIHTYIHLQARAHRNTLPHIGTHTRAHIYTHVGLHVQSQAYEHTIRGQRERIDCPVTLRMMQSRKLRNIIRSSTMPARSTILVAICNVISAGKHIRLLLKKKEKNYRSHS